jgi:hypothetical protein
VVETYSYDNPVGKMKFAIPVSFILFGFLSIIAVIHFLGNWNFRVLSEILKIKRVFLILNGISFLFISAGLCSLMAFMYSDVHKIWRTLFLLFLLGAGVLYLSVHTKVSPAAAGNVFVHHLPVFITLVLAVLCKIIAFKINKKAVNIAGFIFLMMAAFGLLSYREAKKSFEPGSIVIQAVIGNESPKADGVQQVSLPAKEPERQPGNDKTPEKRAPNCFGTGQAKQTKQK